VSDLLALFTAVTFVNSMVLGFVFLYVFHTVTRYFCWYCTSDP